MRPVTSLLLILDVLLGATLGCSPPPQAGPRAGGHAGVVRFPGPWLKLTGGEQVGVNDAPQFVVRRRSAGPGGEELLFALKQGFDGSLFGREVHDFPVEDPGYDYYSDTRFAVSLDRGFRVREATAAEWDAAAKPLHSYHFVKTFQNPRVTAEGVRHNERLYRRSGAAWGTEAAVVSPRGAHIAVLSYASGEKPAKTMIPGFGNTEPGRGELFIDVYDTASGERVIAAREPYGEGGGFEPSVLFGGAFWLDERFFVMPLDPSYESCLLGILPEK